MEKFLLDMRVVSAKSLSPAMSLLRLTPVRGELPPMQPGQFVNVRVQQAHSLLRRPISICNVDHDARQLWLLVRRAGEATDILCSASEGDVFNILLPLGNGFSMPGQGASPLLAGGGVGVAPLLYFGRKLAENGCSPTFLLAAKTGSDLVLLDEFEKYGKVLTATDDGSQGFHGLITHHPEFQRPHSHIFCCGPTPMMKGVARIAKEEVIPCEVSLENMMACGLGACLCCVQPTKHGNQCTCTSGPVFNTKELLW